MIRSTEQTAFQQRGDVFSWIPISLSALSQAAEEARREAVSRAEGAEQELEQRRGELRDLEDKLRKSEEESNNGKARLDSFMKAMGSLQDDRDRVLNVYKQLEEKHLQVTSEPR